MTGRDLIVYILKNNLEDEEVFKDGLFLGLINEEDVASKFGVGAATVRAWYNLDMIKGVQIGEAIFFFADVEDPRKQGGQIHG